MGAKGTLPLRIFAGFQRKKDLQPPDFPEIPFCGRETGMKGDLRIQFSAYAAQVTLKAALIQQFRQRILVQNRHRA